MNLNPDLNVDNYSNDSKVGFFLEVDLVYSDELCDLHDYPLAGEKIIVTKLSQYQL